MKKIAFLTDIHLDEPWPLGNKVTPKENLEVVLADIERRGVQQVIFGGDIGDASAHAYFFKKLKPYSLQLLLGNHDQFTDVMRYCNKGERSGELYYCMDEKYFKYLFLDSSLGYISDAQIAWLTDAIVTTKKPIVYIHHPVLKIDTPADKLFALENRELVKQLLEETQEEVTIFCGHYHMEDVCTYKNIKQITTPSLCFQLIKDAEELRVDNTTFGYRLIDIATEAIETELVMFPT